MNVRLEKLTSTMQSRLGEFSRGAAAVEYVLLVVLISIVLIPVLIVFGPGIAKAFSGVTDKINPLNPVNGSDPSVCVPGSNANHHFDNIYWSYNVDYTDPAMGGAGVVGSMTVNGDSPDGAWSMMSWTHPDSVHADIYPFDQRGSLLNTELKGGSPIGMGLNAELPVGDNGTTLYNYTQYNYENGVAFVFDFQSGTPETLVPSHPLEWHGNVWPTTYVAYTGAYLLEKGTASAPYDVKSAATADDPAFGGGRGAMKSTPPAGADLTCPAAAWTPPTNNGVTCIDNTNSNGWWNNLYWTESANYQANDWSIYYGWLSINGSGSTWNGSTNYESGGTYTQAEAEAAVAAGTANMSDGWSYSIADDGGKLYVTPPDAGLYNTGCPTNPGGGGAG